MSIPKSVQDTIAALRQERMPLAARLDAIDLAIDNLTRVYGLNSSPKPLRAERRRGVERRKARTDEGDSAAKERRDLILAAIERAPHGMTAADLKKATPNVAPKDRANALSVLKAKGEVKRAGNTWVKAA